MVWSKFKKDNSDSDKSSSDVSVPNSLPGTIMDKKGSVKPTEQKPNEDKHLLPKELAEKTTQQFQPKKLSVPSPSKPEEQVQAPPQPPRQEPQAPKQELKNVKEMSENHSYFKQLEKAFNEDKEVSHKHFKDDIISKMKDYHDSKSRGETYYFNEKDSDDHIYKHLLELKELEEEWSVRFKEYNAAKELLLEKEKEIEQKVEVFKKVYVEGEKFKLYNKKVPLDVGFKLSNGHVLRSIQDLVGELKVMSDEVFLHHVTDERNDFENWIRHVFNARDLADKVSGLSSREEFLNVLNN